MNFSGRKVYINLFFYMRPLGMPAPGQQGRALFRPNTQRQNDVATKVQHKGFATTCMNHSSSNAHCLRRQTVCTLNTRCSSQFQNHYLTEMYRGLELGSYLGLVYFVCITQL